MRASLELELVIATFFDFPKFMDDSPQMTDLILDQQRELVATYLDENHADLQDLFERLPNAVSALVAKIITKSAYAGERCEFNDLLFVAGAAAFEDNINDQITKSYDQYCQEFGIYSLATEYDPAELVGWRSE